MACSGLMYAGVPRTSPLEDSGSTAARSIARASPEIAHRGPVALQEQVLRLDVPMEDILPVGMVDRRGDIGDDREHGRHRQLGSRSSRDRRFLPGTYGITRYSNCPASSESRIGTISVAQQREHIDLAMRMKVPNAIANSGTQHLHHDLTSALQVLVTNTVAILPWPNSRTTRHWRRAPRGAFEVCGSSCSCANLRPGRSTDETHAAASWSSLLPPRWRHPLAHGPAHPCWNRPRRPLRARPRDRPRRDGHRLRRRGPAAARRVAVKILRPDVASRSAPPRFLSEIEIASRLTHPHILPVHDSGEDAGVLYYVMPYVEGESLREKLNRVGRLPVEEALAIAREIADALAYAHDLDVVHRDIKPGNVLLLAGHAVVADFGVARAISAAADERVTSAGFIVGTPVYMSPEQAAGDTLDGRTDVYALGCVAYEMLTGTPPFLGETPREVFAKHRSVRPRSLRDLRPEVPPPAAEAIERALGKLPEDRFTGAREFAEALRAPAQWQTAPRPRRRAGLIALAAVLRSRPGWPCMRTAGRGPTSRLRRPSWCCRSTATGPSRRPARGAPTRCSPSSSAGCRGCTRHNPRRSRQATVHGPTCR